jgi:hypothetical protein
MERGEDGKVAFFTAEPTFEIKTIEDAYLVLSGLARASEMFHKAYGQVGYPVYVLEKEDEV